MTTAGVSSARAEDLGLLGRHRRLLATLQLEEMVGDARPCVRAGRHAKIGAARYLIVAGALHFAFGWRLRGCECRVHRR